MRKIRKFFMIIKSMKLGMILLVVLGVTSVAGTIIPQNESVQFYAQNYSAKFNAFIKLFELDNVYFSWWYIALIAMLVLNLTTCIVVRLPQIVRQRKNNIGYLGSWLLHLGILLIIVFFALGNIFAYETNLYGVPGTVGQLENRDLFMKINSFEVLFRDDYTVEQYISNIDILNEKGETVKSGNVYVNSPQRYDHYSFYQTSMGYAVKLKVYKDDENIYEDVFYQSEVYVNDDKSFAVQFANFYPDMTMSSEGPKTKSPYFNNPYMLYVLFYDGYMVDMNVAKSGSIIEYKEYSIIFDNPMEFTLINIRRDLFTPLAFIGALILLGGIMLKFYFAPITLHTLKTEEDVKFYIHSEKNNEMTKSRILLKYDDIRGGEQSDGLE